MNIFITGATGFIGYNLAKYLVQKGHQIYALIRSSQSAAKLSDLNINLIHSDIRELDAECFKNCKIDIIFHLAGLRGEGRGTKDKYQEININGTNRLLATAGKELKRFIYCSSVSVFGKPAKLPADETLSCMPNKIYGQSKYQAEQLVQNICTKKGIPVTIIRPVIAYGPYDYYGMVTKMFKLLDANRFLPVGSGKNRIHLVYISDLVEGFYLAMKEPKAEGEIIILAGKNPITMNGLLSLIIAELHKKVPKLKIPAKIAKIGGFLMETIYQLMPGIFAGEPIVTRDKVDILTIDRCYSIDKANKLLGYNPKVDYGEGIKLTARWLRESNIIRDHP